MSVMWEEALFKAATSGDEKHFEVAAKRVDRIDFENVMKNGNRPLHVAALGGHNTIVVWLLANGADPNRPNRKFKNNFFSRKAYACF